MDKKKFVPLCFKKDVLKFNNYFKVNKDNPHILYDEFKTVITPEVAYSILKNLDVSIGKAIEMDVSKQNIGITEATKISKVHKTCDILSLKLSIPLIKNYINLPMNLRMIRFYSFSHKNNCYFFLYKIISPDDDKLTYFKGGIVLPCHDNKLIFYMKKKHSLCLVSFEKLFNTFLESFKILFTVLDKAEKIPQISRFSTVETLESENAMFDKDYSNEDVKSESLSNFSSSDLDLDEDDANIEDEGEILDLEGFDLEEINKACEEYNEELYKQEKFLGDEDYKKIKKMDHKDLEDLGYLEAYYELKKKIEADVGENVFGDNEIVRYAYGWRGMVDSAKDSMVELLEWRRTFKPEKITMSDFDGCGFDLQGLMSIACQDVYGRPIIVIRAKKLLPKQLNIDVFVKYLIFLIEQSVKLMPTNIDKIVIVIDIKDAGLENFSTEHIKKIKETTSKFYVERLANLVVINKGFFFGFLWKVVKAFLDERVLKKLIVIDDSNMAFLQKMLGDNITKVL